MKCEYCPSIDNLAKIRRIGLSRHNWSCGGIRILCFNCRTASWRINDIEFIEFIKPKKETARDKVMF